MDEMGRAIVLALIQGITEFLPISSSAHLILPGRLLGWVDQGIVFDVAVHLGSLGAVLFYFRRDVLALVQGSLSALSTKRWNEEARLALYLVVATLPVAVAGVLLKSFIEGELRSIQVIACTTIGFGLLLAVADQQKGAAALSLRTAVWVGLAQVLAIIPGTSRSGITMTAALFCGLGREQAARFSFLLAIPVILAASLLAGLDALEQGIAMDVSALTVGVLVSGLTAYATIRLFLGWVQRVGFMPFVIYRCALGLILLWIAYGA